MLKKPKSSFASGPMARQKARKQARKPRLAAFFTMSIAGMVGGLIAIATYTAVPQITRAPGVVVPLGNYTRIESVQGGIVEVVHVGDGEVVEAGAPLLTLHNPDLRREVLALGNERSGLEDRIANANAILEAVSSTANSQNSTISELRAEGLHQAAARLEVYFESQKVKESALEQQVAAMGILQDALDFAQERAYRKQEHLERIRTLLERGLLKQTEFQTVEDQADSLQAAASDASVRLSQERKALMVARAEKINETLALREEIVVQLAELQPELARVITAEEAALEKLGGLQILSPADGLVQAVAFPSVGEVIDAGETIFELLPRENTLIVEARISNIEIGHVAQQSPVAVTFDSFDARRFGKATGTLVSMSPVPLIDEMTGEQYFRASIELDQDSVGEGAYQRPITAGLTVVAEMVTGENTMLAYFLKPVDSTLERAFRER